jgi:hypothetical protein
MLSVVPGGMRMPSFSVSESNIYALLWHTFVAQRCLNIVDLLQGDEFVFSPVSGRP